MGWRYATSHCECVAVWYVKGDVMRTHIRDEGTLGREMARGSHRNVRVPVYRARPAVSLYDVLVWGIKAIVVLVAISVAYKYIKPLI